MFVSVGVKQGRGGGTYQAMEVVYNLRLAIQRDRVLGPDVRISDAGTRISDPCELSVSSQAYKVSDVSDSKTNTAK